MFGLANITVILLCTEHYDRAPQISRSILALPLYSIQCHYNDICHLIHVLCTAVIASRDIEDMIYE